VSVVVAIVPPKMAWMVVVPRLAAVATPSLPEAFDIVATAVFELDHITASLTSCVDPSLNVPVAVNDTVSPFGTLGSVGVMVTDSSDARPTVRNAVAVCCVARSVAVMDTTPAAIPVARPVESTVARVVSLEVHDTAPMSENTFPSLNVPSATKVAWVPT
jgi:hypothetical protein